LSTADSQGNQWIATRYPRKSLQKRCQKTAKRESLTAESPASFPDLISGAAGRNGEIVIVINGLLHSALATLSCNKHRPCVGAFVNMDQ